ncbi:unnamed protein product [Microthlaspi erraticum]|uniref:Fatty acid desaturase domain-containing protein n=1 Tax=Microthlaspi erraticum TaxID=1685480 RepID=A0A6D2IMS8_9BRAS|nr:unnamed protein product [Microthlaspi erraticum]
MTGRWRRDRVPRDMARKFGLPYLRWLCLFTMGESWHNNHHAFESSARQGLEWWQLIDITWYLIRLLEVLGLATDVKLPSGFQKQKLALPG